MRVIGENSTGKTHLLKSINSLNRILIFDEEQNYDPNTQMGLYTFLLQSMFDPRCNLNDLFNQKSTMVSELQLEQWNSDKVSAMIHRDVPNLSISKNIKSQNNLPIFIPTKEMMFFLPDIVSLLSRYELKTDLTYQNIVTDLVAPKYKDEQIHSISRTVIEDIERLIGGTFTTEENLSMTFQENGDVRPANLMAEGFRKFGVLSKLIETRRIYPSVSGPLLWDEPETNLNPKMMKALVEILIKLSEAGQQLILVTHNYVFMKWFELLLDGDNDDQILYHNLYYDENSEIQVQTSNNYADIDSNSIDATYEAILNTQLLKDMEKY